jgi:hypothetical protein
MDQVHVRLEGAVYSVPSRWAGLDLVVRIGAPMVTIVGRDDADSASAQTVWAAVDRLPALPVGAGAQAAGGAAGAAGSVAGGRTGRRSCQWTCARPCWRRVGFA